MKLNPAPLWQSNVRGLVLALNEIERRMTMARLIPKESPMTTEERATCTHPDMVTEIENDIGWLK